MCECVCVRIAKLWYDIVGYNIIDKYYTCTVEPLIKDTQNNGHLSIKDKTIHPNSYDYKRAQ